uniref:Uncharacterized protein n=1 Tax=Chenopodium quinoa TaxID=63459 RepID=A0A803MQE8_CHEQI
MDSKSKHISHGENGILEWEIQEDEELFDIDLALVDNIPPPNYYWENYVMSTGNALLANCLLPVTHLSTAVPVNSGETDQNDHHILSVSVLKLPDVQMPGKSKEFPSLQTLQSKDLSWFYTT